MKTLRNLAAAFLDMDWHLLSSGQHPEPTAFERASLTRIGLPREIAVRYRSTYFNHLFGAGLDYAASYYSYIWSEVLDTAPLPGRSDVGALRLRTVATKNEPAGAFPDRDGAGYHPAVILDLDYWALIVR